MLRLTCALLTLLFVVPAALAQANAERRPNVVLILADDMGWMDAAVYGSRFYETPNLDRLATQGMLFTDAYAANPLCSPTRASILTGLDPARIGFTTPAGHVEAEVFDAGVGNRGPTFKVNDSTSATRLRNEFLTLAEVFKAEGYATGFFGKWHLGRAPYIPQNQGFDTVVGGGPYPGPPGGFFAPWPEPTLPERPAGTHITDATTDAALEWLGEHQDDPFLMCYFLWDVHAPFQAKAPLIQRFAQTVDPDDPQQCPTMAGMLSTMDTNLGRLFYLLEQLSLEDDTLLIFTSDNGGNMYNWVETARGDVRPTSNAPLRGGKAMIYEGGIRVPLIVRWPGRVEAGSTSDALVSTTDLLPTICEAVGIDVPNEIRPDGASYLPVLTGDSTTARDTFVCHFPHYVANPQYEGDLNRPSTSVRRGDWKLIRFYFDNEAGDAHRYELYNLNEDPGETDNRYAGHAALAAELEAAMDEYLADINAVLPQRNPRYTGPATPGIPAGPAPDGPAAEAIDGWTPSLNGNAQLRAGDGVLHLTSTGEDPWMETREPPETRGLLRLTIRIKTDAAGVTQFFWATGDRKAYNAQQRMEMSLADAPLGDDGFRTLTFDFRAEDDLAGLRIDPFQRGPASFEFDSITLSTQNGRVLRAWSFD